MSFNWLMFVGMTCVVTLSGCGESDEQSKEGDGSQTGSS